MLKVTARAKINWALDILGLLDNGYHRMDILTSSVSLADELYLKPHSSLTLAIEGNSAISAEDNLVLHAANALREKAGYTGGAEITLHKHIPLGAGLGGGSADAAATLVGLSRLWRLDLPKDTLHSLASSLGADVAFFLTGGFARIGGFGEEITPLPPLEDIPLVILQPCGPQSSGEAFQLYDLLETISHPDISAAQAALLNVDFKTLTKAAGNVLQQAIQPRTPQIAEALAALDACGAAFTTMTGSGSAVFGAFADESAALSAQRILHKRWKKCWVSRTDVQSITIEEG